MAEILGLVSAGAGLASLSLQLLETAIKLREVYKTYKDAPAALSRTTDEIELFGFLLQLIEKDRQAHDVADDGQAELLGRSIQLCQSSVSNIVAITGALQLAIGRSKRFGKLRIVFEEKEIKDLCAELERAKSSLGLAHQLYTESRRRQDYEQHRHENRRLIEQQSIVLIGQNSTLQQVSQDVALLSQQTLVSDSRCTYSCETEQPSVRPRISSSSPEEDPIAAHRRTLRRSKGRSRKAGLSLKFRPWFSSTIWRITVGEAISGWDIALRTANVVSHCAPIFELCKAGDLLGMQKLIAEGKASIGDETKSGRTLLWDAIFYGHVNICRFLLSVQEIPPDWMLDPQADTTAGGSVRNAMYSFLFHQAGADADFLIDLQPESPRRPKFWSSCPDTSCLQTVMSSVSLDYETLPLELRFQNAASLWGYRSSVQVFIQALGETSRVDELTCLVDREGRTVLHYLAWYEDLFECESAKELFGKVVRAGANLNATNQEGHTPLIVSLKHGPANPSCQDMLARVRSWMELLNASGVDTIAYARRESGIWQSRLKPMRRDNQLSRRFCFRCLEPQVDGEWDLRVALKVRLTVFTTPASVPGIWPIGDTPSSLPWTPTERDFLAAMDGIERLRVWNASEELEILSDRAYLLSELVHREYRSDEQLEQDDDRLKITLGRAQDDCGTVWLALRGRRSFRSDRKRSSSQPADICESFQHEQRRRYTNYSKWLGEYHHCRVDSRWRFGGEPTRPHGFVDQRRCAHGECVIDEDAIWSTIRQCLDYEALPNRRFKFHPYVWQISKNWKARWPPQGFSWVLEPPPLCS